MLLPVSLWKPLMIFDTLFRRELEIMSSPTLCLSCGTALSSGRLHGLCPRCLMRGRVMEPSELRSESEAAFVIPGYENLRELARGGMGIVYQARQLAPEREVAVKMLLPQTITDELRERFRLEARTMADLSDAGILPLHQLGEWAGVPFVTMKLASGGTLASRRATYTGLSGRSPLGKVSVLVQRWRN